MSTDNDMDPAVTPKFSIRHVHGNVAGKQARCASRSTVSAVCSRVVGCPWPVNQRNEGKGVEQVPALP